MTERSQFSFGVSERSVGWSGPMTFIATDSGYPSYPVLPTISHGGNEIRGREAEEFEYIRSSFWDKMGMWVLSFRIRSKYVLRGCCL